MIVEIFCQLSVIWISASRSQSASKVSGGHPAYIGEFPYMAHLFLTSVNENDAKLECGGVIISDTRVLTACECLAEPNSDGSICWNMRDPKNAHVVVGVQNRNDHVHNFTTAAVKFQIHHKCGYNYMKIIRNNLGIVTVAKKFRYNLDIQPAVILTRDKDKYQEQKNSLTNDQTRPLCEFAGWGLVKRPLGSKKPSALQVSQTEIVSNERCLRRVAAIKKEYTGLSPTFLQNDSTETIICGRFRNEVNFGDSGGPLVCDGYLIAIVSNVNFAPLGRRISIFSTLEDVLDEIQVSKRSTEDYNRYAASAGRHWLTDLKVLRILYFLIHLSKYQ